MVTKTVTQIVSSIFSIKGEVTILSKEGKAIVFPFYTLKVEESEMKLKSLSFRAMVEGLKETLMKGAPSKWEETIQEKKVFWNTGEEGKVFLNIENADKSASVVELSPWEARGLLKQLDLLAEETEKHSFSIFGRTQNLKNKKGN